MMLNEKCIKAPSKMHKKELTTVETNTDPWKPQCQMCIERENSQFISANNTVDVNEYVKAINYINSIHSLINESIIARQVQTIGRNSNISLMANFNMPVLPNFLTILSTLNNTNSRNSNINCCQMISRTTSTSSLTNPHTIIGNNGNANRDCKTHNESTQENNQNYENSFLNCNERVNKTLFQINLKENNEGDRNILLKSMEILDSESVYQELDPSELDEIPDQNICKYCSSPMPKRNTQQQNNNKIKEAQEEQRNIGDTRRSREGYQKEKAPKKKDSCNKKQIAMSNSENKAKPSESTLLDTELDRYASELLIGINFASFDSSPTHTRDASFASSLPVPKLSVDKPRTVKTRPHQVTNPEPVRIKKLQKIKDVTPQSKVKQITTGIPIKQTNRPQKSSCKVRTCNSGIIPILKHKNGSSNSESSTAHGSVGFSGKRNLKSSPVAHSSNIECGLLKQERQESPKEIFKTMLNTRPQTLHFQLPGLTNFHAKDNKSKTYTKRPTSGNRYSSTASLPTQKAATPPDQKKLMSQASKGFKNEGVTYKVQQKEIDEFVCPRKNVKNQLVKKSSESVILTDKDDRDIGNFTDSDIFDDTYDVHSKKSMKLCHNHTCSKPASHNNLETLQKNFVPNERLVVSAPLRNKRESRNKHFRQVRKQNTDNEEIINIRNYISQQKRVAYSSDSISNVSHTTGSSDIKSDRGFSPHRLYKAAPMKRASPSGQVHRGTP